MSQNNYYITHYMTYDYALKVVRYRRKLNYCGFGGKGKGR